jgi:hypothetical protein
MSKLIDSPRQCIHRKPMVTNLGFLIGYYCNHPEGENCPNIEKFPEDCPLVEGLPKKSIHWP